MANFDMIAKSPLDGFQVKIGALNVEEVTGFALVSIAIPLGGEQPVAAALKKAHNCTVPEPVDTVTSDDGAQFIWMAPGQIFARFPNDKPWPERRVATALGAAAYVVDQSDAWVTVRVKGETVCDALERICPLDLHPVNFAVGQAKRTVMEHMNALLIRVSLDEFLCMSASSSAKSFLHAIEVSARNIAN